MTEPTTRISKWPFLGCDLVLIAVSFWIVKNSSGPLGPIPLLAIVTCLIAGAAFAVQPFLAEYRAAIRFAESHSLIDAVAQIQKLEEIGQQVALAIAQSQAAQEQSAKTVGAAKEIAERMEIETKSFGEFMAKSNDTEKSHLRLEVEKLRRGEAENLQILVHILDHTYALFRAGQAMGQANVMRQLTQFQTACREAVRRLGLVPIEAAAGELYDQSRHQLVDPDPKPSAGTERVGDTLATGYSFQGQLIRRIVVELQTIPSATTTVAATTITPEAPDTERPLEDSPVGADSTAQGS